MRPGAGEPQTAPLLRRSTPCVYESIASSQKSRSRHMPNGHDPNKPPQNPGTGTGSGTGTGTGTGTGKGGKPTPDGGSNEPPQTKKLAVAVAAGVGGLVGGVVGALIGSGMHH